MAIEQQKIIYGAVDAESQKEPTALGGGYGRKAAVALMLFSVGVVAGRFSISKGGAAASTALFESPEEVARDYQKWKAQHPAPAKVTPTQEPAYTKWLADHPKNLVQHTKIAPKCTNGDAVITGQIISGDQTFDPCPGSRVVISGNVFTGSTSTTIG